ncbi:hypothetical protein Tco_1264702 [Tanacetum coccineum]
MSIQDMEVQKQQYLEEMQSIINQIQIKDYHNERIDIHYRRECEIKINELKAKFNKMSMEINKSTKEKELRQRDQERTIPFSEIISRLPPSIAITPVLPIKDPEDSLIMGNEELSTIPEKESDEFIKSSVEDLVPILSESEDTSGSDSECDLPSCNDCSPINIPEGKSVTFSNPFFDSNEDFTSSDDESLSDEDDIESKDSYVSKLDEPDLLVTSLSDAKEDECFDLGGDIEEIDGFLDIDVSTDIEDDYYDSKGDTIYLESLIFKDTILNLPPRVFLDRDPRILEDEPDKDDLKNIVKVFDPGIQEKIISPTYVRLSFEDRHYLSLPYVIQIFLPYLTYSMNSSLPLSSGSEDTIFDPGISAFHFSSLEPVDCPDFEDSRARGFVHRSLDLQSLACLWESNILDLIDSRLSISIIIKRL